MRLIDADLLIEWIDAGHLRNPNELCFSEADVVEMIDHMPTIEERKTGKWKITYLDHVAAGERPGVLYCSCCKQCIAYPTNYCPNCGADMRGE